MTLCLWDIVGFRLPVSLIVQGGHLGWTKSCTTGKPWDHGNPLFAGIYRGIIIPGFLRWCGMDFIHPQYFGTAFPFLRVPVLRANQEKRWTSFPGSENWFGNETSALDQLKRGAKHLGRVTEVNRSIFWQQTSTNNSRLLAKAPSSTFQGV